jgi:hypothetical protein
MNPGSEGPVLVEARFSIDASVVHEAERELGRALILQNARAAQRFDVFSRLRTVDDEARVRRIGTAAASIGLGLSLLCSVKAPVFLLVALVFAGLLLVFRSLFTLRQRMVNHLDRSLRRRAATVASDAWARHGDLDSTQEGREVVHRLASSRLDVDVEPHDPTRGSSLSLSSIRYGLLGDHCLLLFARKQSQLPRAFLLWCGGEERDRLRDGLRGAGVEIEILEEGLLPRSTIARDW